MTKMFELLTLTMAFAGERRLAEYVSRGEKKKETGPPYPWTNYPKFYKSLTSGYEKDKGYSYLTKDTPQLFKNLSVDCTAKDAPMYCYGVTVAMMKKAGY